MKSIEVTASSYDEALRSALEQLGLEENEVDTAIVKESGLIKKKVTVKVTQKLTGQLAALEFIEGAIERMGFNCEVEMSKSEEGYLYNISGPDVAHIIGYRGDVLDSLQYLALLIANSTGGFDGRIIVDGENYREKRVQVLTKLARRLAFKAAKSGEAISLEPMNPFERRVIHSALAGDNYVTTHSEGDEPSRYVVIAPNKKRGEGRQGGRRDGDRRRSDRNRGERTTSAAPTVSKSNIEYHTDIDMYDASSSVNFKKKGFGKTKSYGNNKRFF
ncbi:MAG: protein jag [Clostridia bacterium]|nr:protein jag [Clostridia bacterium]